MCIIIIFALPLGDAYNFVINFVRLTFITLHQQLTHHPLPQISYPVSIVNAIISFFYDGWLTVSVPAQLAAICFGAANVFLFVVPFVPPSAGGKPYTNLPYWSHAVGGWAIFGIGFLYWLVWVHLLPRIGGYTLVQLEEVGRDGLTRCKFKRISLSMYMTLIYTV